MPEHLPDTAPEYTTLQPIHCDPLGGSVHLSNGEVVPITTMFDTDGEEVLTGELDLHNVLSVVAGPTAEGMWLSFTIDRYIGVQQNA